MMKKNLFSLGIMALIIAAMTSCVDNIPTNPFLGKYFQEEKDKPVVQVDEPVIPVNGKVNAAVPVISSQPQSEVYTVGVEAVALTVSASVSDGGTLSYQWYGDDAVIEGAAGTSYTPPTDQLGTAYYYAVVTNTIADNGDGGNKSATVVSHSAKIEVNDKVNAAVPHILSQPLGAEYTYGDTAAALTVSASISDSGTLSYRWYRNEIDSNEGGTVITGATGASYTPPVSSAGMVYYYVEVTNTIADNGDGGNKSATERSDVAAITVNKANPTVTWPTGLTATYGQTLSSISLPGNGTGSPAGTFTWTTPSNAVGSAGTRSHSMTFTPNETANYNTLTQNVNITVNKANPTITWPTGLIAYYTQTLSNISLPGNGTGSPAGAFTWTTPSNSVGSEGIQSHNMTFTPTNTTNYNVVSRNVDLEVVGQVEIVNIPGGTFTMGSPATETGSNSDERPQRQVTLSGFSLGKYEVTQAQYEAVMGTNPSYYKTNADAGETQNRRPVEQVRWYDVLVFCNKLSMLEGLSPAYSIGGSTNPDNWGAVPQDYNATWNAVVMAAGSNGYRLPTEAQWEYACRAGTTTAYNTGDTISDATGWYSDNSGGTHEVGKKLPNAWGLYDMHGNVWEWCWDWYGTYPGTAETDPVGASSGSYRVRRGGGLNGSAQIARSAYRGSSVNPRDRFSTLGFRVLRPAQ